MIATWPAARTPEPRSARSPTSPWSTGSPTSCTAPSSTATSRPARRSPSSSCASSSTVSHIPVREALRRLESEGLLSLRPGRSALVASLSVEDLSGIYRLRKLIEGDLAERATATMTEERLAGAKQALDEYAEIEREPASLAAAHHAFHAAMLDDVTGSADRRVLEHPVELHRPLPAPADGRPRQRPGDHARPDPRAPAPARPGPRRARPRSCARPGSTTWTAARTRSCCARARPTPRGLVGR